MPDYIFDQIDTLISKINNADNVILFLDFDGTLVSYQDRPQDVSTSKEVVSIISHLIGLKGYYVAIVTGRTLADIRKLIDIQGLTYAALHGLQIQMSDGSKHDLNAKKDIQHILKEIKTHAIKRFQNESGIILEDKQYTFALHYRMVENNNQDKIIKDFLDIIKSIDTNNRLDILQGSKLIETRPKGWNKGKAVELLTSKLNSQSVIPIYIGDDTTDEDAFDILKDKGITIFVSNNSNRQTAAKYWLKDPTDVLNFLEVLRAN